MKPAEIYDILNELEVEKYKFKNLKEILSIKLSSGREIFMDWLHIRVRFMDERMDIQYGHSIPYGSRLSCPLFVGGDLKSLNCQVNEEGSLQIPANPITGKVFRDPEIGDTIRSSLGKNILSEAIIIKILPSQQNRIFILSQPISADGRFSYFDSMEYKKNEYYDHGISMEGVYMKFIPNTESISKKEIIHESIKYKDILSINLNLENKKKYTLKGVNYD